MKKHLSLILCAAMLVTLFAGCSPAANSGGGNNGGGAAGGKDSVVAFVPDIFNTLDPRKTAANSDQYVFDQIYETLAVTQDDGSVKPCLAESWDVSDDGLVYTFHLVKDAKFQNGETFKASDVVFTYNQFLNAPTKANFVNMVEKVEAVDDNTVQITLDKVTPLFLVYTNEVPIMNEKFVTEQNDDISEVACGTGPYQLESIDFATAAKLTRFEDYRQAPAAIKNVELRYVGDTSTAVVQLETGEIDIMQVAPTQLGTLLDNSAYTNVRTHPLKTAVFAINVNVPPLDNKLVRQALTYACDKQSIIAIAYEGYATPARLQANDINCFGVDFSGAEDFTYNPEKAKELLAQAGFPDGLNLSDYNVVLDVMGGTYLEKAAQVFQQNLADIGVKLELRNTSTPDEDAESGNFSLMTQTLSYRADFSYSVSNYGTVGIGGNNFCQLSDPYVDEMFAKGEAEQDPAQRQAIYKELIEYLVDLCPSIPLFHHEIVYVWNSNLEAVAHDSAVHPFYCYEWSWKA
ncbi:diguanylate phosphodiesterase [Oscillospiraceae bacterium]|nr:diguanylate phosphodiesterase [Oscillospiraceae bacterium]BDF76881.1 diguanylate phosphodiesterase [Oscillospiraceae bacterium]